MNVAGEQKVIDPILYVTVANPEGVQKILTERGLPQAEDIDNLYELITRLHNMYPEETGKKLLSIHPDKNDILNHATDNLKQITMSNFTGDELASYKKEKSTLSLTELQSELATLNMGKTLAGLGIIAADPKVIEGFQQKINIINELIVSNTTKAGGNAPTFSVQNLTPNQKILGGIAIGLLIGWVISSVSK